jgi:hypothetical protein
MVVAVASMAPRAWPWKCWRITSSFGSYDKSSPSAIEIQSEIDIEREWVEFDRMNQYALLNEEETASGDRVRRRSLENLMLDLSSKVEHSQSFDGQPRFTCPIRNGDAYIDLDRGEVFCECVGENHTGDDVEWALLEQVRALPRRCTEPKSEFGHFQYCLKCRTWAKAADKVTRTISDRFDRAEPDDVLEVEGILLPRWRFEQVRRERLIFKLGDRAAEDDIQAAQLASAPDEWISGDLLYELPSASPIWGPEDAPYSSAGQGWMICGQDGSGKSTMAQQYLKGRLWLPSWSPLMLELEVRPLRADQTVLYIAADRPQQILEGLQRGIELSYREELGRRLKIHQGAPPLGLLTEAGQNWLINKVQETNAGLVVIDSRKDVGSDLDPSEVLLLNKLVQRLSKLGVEVLILHHPVQKTGKRPNLTDVKGLREVFSGLGSVLMLTGQAASGPVKVTQLKPIREERPQLEITFDLTAGRASVVPGHQHHHDGGGDDLKVDVRRVDMRRVELRAVFTQLAGPDGWALAKPLRERLKADRLDRAFDGYMFDAQDNPKGPIESSGSGLTQPSSSYCSRTCLC